MTQRSLLSHRGHWLTLAPLMVLLAALLTGCTGGLETTAPTRTPIPPARPTDTPSPARPTNTPTPAPPGEPFTPIVLPVVPLPDDIIAQAEQIAQSKSLKLEGAWAPEQTTLYALPGIGLIYALNTVDLAPADRKIGLAADGQLDNVVLGALFVTDAAAGDPADYFKPGVYVIALGSQGRLVNYFSQDGKREAPADLRTFKSDLVAARPFALISSEQVCLTWDALQVCARQRTPLPQPFQNDLGKAAEQLGVPPGWFAIERGIFDIEGVNNLQRCADAIKNGAFADCQPSILVAPINEEGLKAPPPPDYDPLTGGRAPLAALARAPRAETAQAGLIGVAVVFSETIEDVYNDPQLTARAASLPADAYLVYDVVFGSDPQIGVNNGQPITLSRVELRVSPLRKFYLPDVRNIPLLGTAVNSNPPADVGSEAAAVHLLLRIFGRQICVFKARECPSLRNIN